MNEPQTAQAQRSAQAAGAEADAPCCEQRVTLLHAESVGVRYANEPALRDVTLPICRGCITAIVGPSGCGKSTFLHTLNRMTDLIPDAHVTGRITLDGQNVLDPAVNLLALRRRIGMIFQKPNPFPLSIRKNLTFPLRQHGVRRRSELDHRLESTLEQVGLWDEVKNRLDRPALDLSGGQQQRLCLARALVLEPEVLLLDEPCSALDPIASGVVEDLIVSLRSRYTIVIVTHNLAQARRIADDLAVFWREHDAGTVSEHGPAASVFSSPRSPTTAAYLSGARG